MPREVGAGSGVAARRRAGSLPWVTARTAPTRRTAAPLDGVTFTSAPLPKLAGMSTALDAARAYYREPPPYGRVSVYPATVERPDLVRAEGEGWSLIGELSSEPVAFVLLDTIPAAQSCGRWSQDRHLAARPG
ncbi:MAG TPA: hypothetical protein VM347_43705 [Nonomuraea sp.]|nr:hypothetical protein [Nonomuraea sp.]